MKETISVNLASQAFTFDKDAYRRLKEYLDAIRRRLPAGDPEILNDVEARLADLSGAVVAVAPMVGGRATLNAPRRGLYLLRVVCRGGGSSVAKVVL